MQKIWKVFNRIVFGLVIVVSILIILTSLSIGGKRIFVVKSGSMEPRIHTGSVVFDMQASDYVVGDVITFKVSNSKDTVTHRIVEIKPDVNKNIFYVVKGDANNAPDPDPVSEDNVVGKVLFSIPYLGYLIAFIKTMPGIVIFIIIPATIIVYQEVTNIKEEIKKLRAAEKEVVKEEKKFVAWWRKQLVRLRKWMENNRKAANRGVKDE